MDVYVVKHGRGPHFIYNQWNIHILSVKYKKKCLAGTIDFSAVMKRTKQMAAVDDVTVCSNK